MIEYIKDVHGFEDRNITVLMDDGEHREPTRDNILNAYTQLVQQSEAGDCCYCHYSGKMIKGDLVVCLFCFIFFHYMSYTLKSNIYDRSWRKAQR